MCPYILLNVLQQYKIISTVDEIQEREENVTVTIREKESVQLSPEEVPQPTSPQGTLQEVEEPLAQQYANHTNPPTASLPVSAKNIKSKSVPKDEVKSLLSSSFGNKQALHSFYCCKERDCRDISNDHAARIKAKDKFQHAWISDQKLIYCDDTGYHWLVYEEGKGMFCILCRKHNSVNLQNKTKKFNIDASVRYKHKTVEEHACSAKHMASIETELLSRGSTFQKEINRREQVREDVYYNALLSLYWIAKEELPNCKFTRLLKLLGKLKLPDIDLFQHRSAGTVREMLLLLLLGITIKEKVLEGVARCFSMLCDEVSDVSNKEQLTSFVQFVDHVSAKVKINFLAVDDVLEEFDSANADAIKSTIMKQVRNLKLNVDKLSGLATDSASVMTGKRNGVAALIRRECKLLLNVHCICHRLALACGDVNDHVQYIQTVEKVLVQLWSFFKNSPKKSASYAKAFMVAKSITISDPAKTKVISRKFKKACRTRWLSTERATDGVFLDFVPLTQTLRVYKEANDCTASGLLNEVANIKFHSTVYLLHEVLPALSYLSKAFQRGTISFSAIHPAINYTVDQLSKIAAKQKPLENLKKDLDEDGRLASTELTLTASSEGYLRNLTVRYVDALKENIDNRFSESLRISSAFEIFDLSASQIDRTKLLKSMGVLRSRA